MGALTRADNQQRDSGERRGLAIAPSTENIEKLTKHIASYRGTFGRLLPPHIDAETFVGIAAGALWKNQDLAAAALAHPESLLVALRDCARLGHQPGTDQYALTVREIGKRKAILGIEQYQGVIERMFRAGAVLSVHAEVITGNERFVRRDPDFPIHEVPDWLDRDTTVGALRGAYAYAVLEGGRCSRVVAMGRPEIMRHREVAATTKIWDGDFGSSMWLKTVCHELEKWVPTSAEYRREQARAAAEMATAVRDVAQAQPAPAPRPSTPATVDGTWTETPQPQPDVPAERQDDPGEAGETQAGGEPGLVEGQDVEWGPVAQPGGGAH